MKKLFNVELNYKIFTISSMHLFNLSLFQKKNHPVFFISYGNYLLSMFFIVNAMTPSLLA